jgi:hypothetical protein
MLYTPRPPPHPFPATTTLLCLTARSRNRPRHPPHAHLPIFARILSLKLPQAPAIEPRASSITQGSRSQSRGIILSAGAPGAAGRRWSFRLAGEPGRASGGEGGGGGSRRAGRAHGALLEGCWL